MTVKELKIHLRSNAEKPISIHLPDGSEVPAHYHVTEVGHVTKRFIDCGGTKRFQETCLLQTWVHDDVNHRLLAGKLAAIFDHASDVLPHENLEVEVEHELDVVAQFTLGSIEASPQALILHLGEKHTDCLARGICLPGTCESEEEGLIEPLPSASSSCKPGSGCC